MSIYHDEVEIEDFEYDEEEGVYYYPCPCGDRFEVTKVRLFRIEELLRVMFLMNSFFVNLIFFFFEGGIDRW